MLQVVFALEIRWILSLEMHINFCRKTNRRPCLCCVLVYVKDTQEKKKGTREKGRKKENQRQNEMNKKNCKRKIKRKKRII